eukprot:Clim_evm6s158 gene=Clim_evmTU6s158
MKNVYTLATLAIVSRACANCVELWSPCDGAQDECCSGYCSKANPDDESTQCIPHVPESDICSVDGFNQYWVCEENLRCIISEDATEATCQATPAGTVYCGSDNTADNSIDNNGFCDDTQYCYPVLSKCWDYLDEGATCKGKGPFFECKEGLICVKEESPSIFSRCVVEQGANNNGAVTEPEENNNNNDNDQEPRPVDNNTDDNDQEPRPVDNNTDDNVQEPGREDGGNGGNGQDDGGNGQEDGGTGDNEQETGTEGGDNGSNGPGDAEVDDAEGTSTASFAEPSMIALASGLLAINLM